MLPVTDMNQIQKPVYDFQLMEQMNSFLVVSLVLTGTPSRYSKSGQPFSFLDMLPVTDLGEGASISVEVEPKQGPARS